MKRIIMISLLSDARFKAYDMLETHFSRHDKGVVAYDLGSTLKSLLRGLKELGVGGKSDYQIDHHSFMNCQAYGFKTRYCADKILFEALGILCPNEFEE